MGGTTVRQNVSDSLDGTVSKPGRRDRTITMARGLAAIDALQAEARSAAGREADHEDRHETERQVIAQLRADRVLHEQHAMHLREALRSSRMIGAAIGIVMVDRNVGEDEAFAVLSRASQDTNRKLSAIAQELVERRTARHLPQASTRDAPHG